MTREERTKRLNDALAKAYAALDTRSCDEMMEQSTRVLLKNIMDMEWMRETARFGVPEPSAPESTPPAPTAPATEPSTPAVPTMTKEELRDKLSTYSNKYDSLDVAALMSSMGYNKLSDVPAERYAELLALVEDSIKAGA